MTNSKNTKKSLYASALALLLCFVMLIGTTFAWFTDSASTGVNTITAGNLDLAFMQSTDNGETWSTAEGQVLNFTAVDGKTDVLWEPGATFKLPAIKLVNNGNLALKFNMAVSGVYGDLELADVLEVRLYDAAGKYTSAGTLADFLKAGEVAHGIILPTGKTVDVNAHADEKAITTVGETAVYRIGLHMQEEAGNKYQGMSLSGMTFTAFASQYTYENDSFNNQYDVNAATVQGQNVIDLEAAGYVVADTVEELVGAFANGENVVLAGDIALTSGLNLVKEKTMILDLNGYTVSYNSSETNANAAITNSGNLTIKDSADGGKITYISTAPSAAHAYSTNTITNLGNGILTIDGGIIENATNGGSSNAIDVNSSMANAKLTVNDGRIIAEKIAIRLYANSTTGSADATFNGGHVYSGTRAVQVHVATDGSKANLDIHGGTFTGTDYSVLTIRGTNSFNDFDEIVVNIDNATLNGAHWFLAGIGGTQNIA